MGNRRGKKEKEIKKQRKRKLPTGSCNQPVQHGVQIRLFFGTDAVAADFTPGD